MKRIWGFVVGGVVLASVAAGSLSACAHDDSSIFVESVLAPPLVAPGTPECTFTADPSQTAISSGTLDIALRDDYEASFLLANQLVPRGDPTAPTTETSYVNIWGAIVTINDSSGNQLKTFTRLGSVLLPPASGGAPGYAPLPGMIIIDSDTVAALGNLPFGDVRRLVVFTKFYGYTLGGEYVESDNYEFPVDVCNTCLITFSATDISPACQNINCLGSTTATTTTATIPCDYEDFPVDCFACRGFALACDPQCVAVPPEAGTAATVDSGATDAGGG